MKLFKVIRNNDESGISGIGHVIDGVIFDDGTTVIKWLSDTSSIAIYKSYEDFKFLHIDSHPTNNTEVIFLGVVKISQREINEEILRILTCLIHSTDHYDREVVDLNANAFLMRLQNMIKLPTNGSDRKV